MKQDIYNIIYRTCRRRLAIYCSILFGVMLLVACVEPDDTAVSELTTIRNRGVLRVGTTGDYRPLSYLEPSSGQYWGFDIDLSQLIATSLGVRTEFVATTWPTLSADMQNDSLFDIALCGITITDARNATMRMSDGYLNNGKTILCRAEDTLRYTCLDSIDQTDVVVMVNPGGLNESFARNRLHLAQVVVHNRNEEIPALIAKDSADIMITEITEAPWYVLSDTTLAAPLLDKPFTSGQIGVLMRKTSTELARYINALIARYQQDGTLDSLKAKYGLH